MLLFFFLCFSFVLFPTSILNCTESFFMLFEYTGINNDDYELFYCVFFTAKLRFNFSQCLFSLICYLSLPYSTSLSLSLFLLFSTFISYSLYIYFHLYVYLYVFILTFCFNSYLTFFSLYFFFAFLSSTLPSFEIVPSVRT